MSAPEERYSDALEAAARHARQWLESQETRHVGPRVTAADLAPPSAVRCRGRDAGGGGGGLPGHEGRTRAHGHALRTVLRLGHRRHPAGGAGRGLAGQRLGPERRAPLGHPARRPSKRPPALAAGAAGSPRRVRCRVRHRRHDGELRRAGRGAVAPDGRRRLGPRRRRPRRRPADPLLRGPGTARLDRPRPAVSGAGAAHGGPRGPAGPHRPVGAGPCPGQRR